MSLFSNKKVEKDSGKEDSQILSPKVKEYIESIPNPEKSCILREMAILGLDITIIPKSADYVAIKILHKIAVKQGICFVEKVIKLNFNVSQLKVILKCIEADLEVNYILDPKLRDKQMLTIMNALELGLNPAPLLDGNKSELLMSNLIKRMLALKEDTRFTSRLNKPDLTDDEVLIMFSELNGKTEVKSNGNLKRFADFQMLFNGSVTGSLTATVPFTGNLTSVGGMSCDLDFEVIFESESRTYTVILLFAESEIFRQSKVSSDNPILLGNIHKVIEHLNIGGESVKADILVILDRTTDSHKQFRLSSFNELKLVLDKAISLDEKSGVSLLMIDNQIIINAFSNGIVLVSNVLKLL